MGDTIIYIHCPEIMECPLHFNEVQLIDGLLKDISEILKYSFVVTENRSIIYFAKKIDLDYKLETDEKKVKKILKYSFILRDKSLTCECDITRLLSFLTTEKAFINEYTNLIKSIVKDIGEKTITCSRTSTVQVKYADLKRHYNK